MRSNTPIHQQLTVHYDHYQRYTISFWYIQIMRISHLIPYFRCDVSSFMVLTSPKNPF